MWDYYNKISIMKELEKKLKDLQKNGYETVSISQVLSWISEIRRENRLKAFVRRGGGL
jgi:hypothetical protein